jgi:heme A synthase
MGCPSWPLCYGRLGPVDQYSALWEQSHRYLVGLVTVTVIATALVASRSSRRRVAVRPAVVAVGLIVVQAALGAVTVLAHNAPWTVAVHLVVGFTFFASTIVTAVVAIRAPRVAWSPTMVGVWGWGAIAATLILVVVGTIVVGTGAGDDCPSWPLCTHAAPTSMIAWQLVHRTIASLAALAMIGFVAHRWRATRTWPTWRALAGTLLVTLALAGGFGAGSALTRASAGWQDLHLAMAAAVWGMLVVLVAMLATGSPAPRRPPTDVPSHVPAAPPAGAGAR